EAHGVSAATLLVVALIHAAAALKHHFIDRDDVLRRMLPVKLRRPPSVE
ncbi:MAG TPA: cytochrome b/b6 domain-containing protein, partial [Steroidobacter sp.]|nr:cytochrome b/b6 domain-containing protein [Steroidobacter sp.]